MKEKSLHNFLNDLGITSVSESTKKYLLDMTNGDNLPSQSVIVSKFNTHLNSVKGGAIVMPMEYFNPDHNGPYSAENIKMGDMFTTAPEGYSKAGLEFNMPMKGGLFSYKDFSLLNINKIRTNKNTKKYVIDKLNVDISDSLKKASKSHPTGKLTKTNLKKYLK